MTLNIRELLKPSDLEQMLETVIPMPRTDADEIFFMTSGALVSFLSGRGDRWEPFHLRDFIGTVRDIAADIGNDDPGISAANRFVAVLVVSAELNAMTAQGLIRSCPEPYHRELTDLFIETCIKRYNLMLPQ